VLVQICFDEIVALSDVEPRLTQKKRMARVPELLCRHGARLAERIVAKGQISAKCLSTDLLQSHVIRTPVLSARRP
jgi:hypothetical protein